MKKGDLVRLSETCFTVKSGGSRRYPLSNYKNDEERVVMGHRPISDTELSEWYDSPASKGMNDAGESRLPPVSQRVILHADRVYPVLRARCRVRLGYGNPTPGLTKIMCTKTGQIAYVKRSLLEIVNEGRRCCEVELVSLYRLGDN